MTAAEKAERLRERARDYELNALAQEERGDATAATSFASIAIALHEYAAIEEDAAEDD